MPTGYTDTFGGSPVQPADVSYAAIALAASINVYWPPFATGAQQPLARLMDVTPSAVNLTITLPDARQAGAGQDAFFNNLGADTYTVLDNAGNSVATIAPGQQKYFYLADNSTQAGTWRVMLFGIGSSSLDASQLQGYGLKAIANTLNIGAVATTISGDTIVTSADRSKVFIWTGGSGTLTLPTTVGSTSDFAIEVRNQGTGTVTLAPVGGVLIDASATITLSVQESCFAHMGATDWYTVGRGRNTMFNFTQLAKVITGGTTTLTLAEASNVVQKYTGALTSNATVILPAVVQVYYVDNATTGTYTLTFGSAGGGTSVAVTQGQAAILFSDGVNVINANTSLDSGISSIIFAAGTATTPSVAIAESVTGLYSSGTHEIGFTSNGVHVGKFTGSGFMAVGAITAASITANAGTVAALSTRLVTNTGSTYTVLSTDHTVVQTTAASTYTLPIASSFPGRRLHIVTQFGGAITSASSDVVPITGGAANTIILTSVDGGYVILQSNGTNWLIVAKSENSGVFNVRDFGAIGDGVADDTTEIQAAITAAGAVGGTVLIPDGTYLLSATLVITLAKTTIRGQSKGGTTITRASDYGSTFDFHGDSGTGALLADCGIESLTIKSTALTTSGAHIAFTGVTRSSIRDIYFYNGFIGVLLNGATACYVDDIYLVFDNLYTGSATGRRYMSFGNAGGSYAHQSSGDIFVSNFNLRGTVTTQYTEYGVNIESADGIWFNNGHVGNASSANILVSGVSTEPLNLVYFENVMSDEGAARSLRFSGSTSTNYRDIKFSNCTFKSGGAPAYCDYGVVFDAACPVQHVKFSNCTVSEFAIGGVVINSTASRLLSFADCAVFGNGRDASGTQPGYSIAAGVQDVEISGGLSGRAYNGTGTGTQSYGIQFGGAHTNFRVIGVDLTGNVTGSITGAETVYVADCLTQESTIVASASTLTLPNSGSLFHISGTTTIGNIQTAQTGRVATLIFDGVVTVTDTGNKTLAGAFTSAAGDSLTLSYDGTNWVEVSRAYTAGPGPGSFTTLAASSTVSGTGFSTYLASPPAIGGTAPAAGTFTTVLATGTGGVGYSTGAGGTVTQATNKTTTVTLNKPVGQITTNNAALASLAAAAFQVNNSTAGANDVCIVTISTSSPNYSSYEVKGFTFAGGMVLSVKNISAGSLSDALIINYAVIKGAIS